MHVTDEALMLSVRGGDVGKLGLLFERHHTPLFDFFCRMIGNRTAAEDLTQDVFFRILKYRGTYRDESHFRTWMYQIARNVRADYFKKHRFEAFLPDDAADVPAQGSFPHQLERDQENELLKHALMKLPEEKRELLILARYREMKYEEIAQVLDVETGTVKVRVHRALKELREIFLRVSGEKASCNVKKSEASLRIV